MRRDHPVLIYIRKFRLHDSAAGFILPTNYPTQSVETTRVSHAKGGLGFADGNRSTTISYEGRILANRLCKVRPRPADLVTLANARVTVYGSLTLFPKRYSKEQHMSYARKVAIAAVVAALAGISDTASARGGLYPLRS